MINHNLYRCIDQEHQQKIEESLIERHLKKGDSLFWDSEDAKYVYFVISGNLKVFKTSYNGHETIFDIYDSNSFVALGVLFNEPQIYPASCQAVSDSIVYALEIKVLEDAVVANSVSARKWIAYMNKRLTTIQRKLSDQIFADSLERFRKLVQYFHSKYPFTKEGGTLRISVPITKQEIADILNIRRETFSRMLSNLKDEGICDCIYKEIIVNQSWLFSELFDT